MYGKSSYGQTFLVHIKDNYYAYNHDWYNDGNIEYTLIEVQPDNIELYIIPGIVSFMKNDILVMNDANKILKSDEFKKQLEKL